MASTLLGNVLEFLKQLGVYDVLLPFLLVFTIVFAILERTRIFGTEKIDNQEYPKKNLNAMAAFVISFLVIASSQLVAAITQISSQMVLVLFLVVFSLLLVGAFYEEGKIGKEGFREDKFKQVFMIVIFLAVLFIFLNALTYKNKSWLEFGYDFLRENITIPAIGSILLVIFIIAFIFYVTKGSEQPTSSSKQT